MNQTQITQCPKCDTTFRVTPAQLKAAKGAVRCGACLHVFRASNHFIDDKKSVNEAKDDRTQDLFDDELFAEPSQPAPQAENNDFDDGLIHDEMDNVKDDFLIDDNNGLIDDDNGLIDDGPKTSSVINDFDEDFLSINPDEVEDPFFSDSEKLAETVSEEGAGEDEAWAQALLDDSDNAPEIKTKNKPKPKPSPQVSTASQAQFTYIEDDPLDLTLPSKRNMAQIWGFAVASILMIVVLIGQVAFFNFDQMARQTEYRPWYQIICNQLGCTLPSTFDLNKIRSTASPQVTSHPKYQNALMVDVLFINNADYEQPFPKVELSFSDSNDKVIAHRVFKSDEYLAGEAAGLTHMPSQTPIHIALEIRDPGKSASNYQVRFLEP